MSPAPFSPEPPTPLPVRIVAALFAVGAVLALAAIPIAWSLLGAEADAGGITREMEFHNRVVFLTVGCVLAAIYAGAGWFLRAGRNWNMAMLLSVGAGFGFPIGTALSVAAIVVLLLPGVRTTFRIRSGIREN